MHSQAGPVRHQCFFGAVPTPPRAYTPNRPQYIPKHSGLADRGSDNLTVEDWADACAVRFAERARQKDRHQAGAGETVDSFDGQVGPYFERAHGESGPTNENAESGQDRAKREKEREESGQEGEEVEQEPLACLLRRSVLRSAGRAIISTSVKSVSFLSIYLFRPIFCSI